MAVIEQPVQLEIYNLLRAALSLFKKSPYELAEAELSQARTQAVNEFRIESKVLNTPEAAAVIITEQELQQAYQEIQGRYSSEDAFLGDLEKNRLDKDSLLAALHRQCKVNTVLELVAGREPLLVEIKSEWEPPDMRFLQGIAALSAAYKGPLALMSFDPAVMKAIKELAPGVPRGIVSGLYEGPGWWRDKLDEKRAYALSHFLESRSAAPDFYAYDVKALPTPVTRFVREVLDLPLFTWTVRTPEQRAIAERWADAPIFEGYEP